MALLWSAIAAGLSMGASLLAKGYFMSNWKECQAASYWRISVIPLVYYRHYGPPAIIYRKHRDCGTTRHAKPTMSNVGLLMRLWGVVLLGNILGTGIAAWAFEYMPIFNEETRDAFVKSAWM